MRIFAISDLHLDYEKNAQWFYSLSRFDYQNDILILAGDISDNIKLLERCFTQLAQQFSQVIYVPGNHDLWVIRSPQKDSIEKFRFIQMLAQQTGICMETYTKGNLSIVPLLGWYDYSFGLPSDELKNRWMDFFSCKWPEHYNNEQLITRFFTEHNEPLLDIKNKMIISCSHFLPRIDLMSSFIPKVHQISYPVLGSTLIEAQIRRLKPQIHIYGHSHVNQHIKIDNITYINNAFGNPSETRIARKQLLRIASEITSYS